MRGLLAELNCPQIAHTIVCCDNQLVFQIAGNPMYHEMTKHIEVNCHFIRYKIQEKVIQNQHISTGAQLDDLLTKALRK